MDFVNVCIFCRFTQACNLSTHKKRYHFRKLNHGREMNVSNMPKGIFNKRIRPEDVKRYPCPHCKVVFRRVEHVKAHILSNHVARTVNGGSNSRSPSTSSGVSSSSSISEGIPRGGGFKQENQSHIMPNMNLHCKRCKLTFPERVSYQKHMYAHAKQEQSQRPANAIQVSNSSGQKVNLRELVSQIQTSKEQPPKPKTQQEVMKKLSGLGMEISLHPLRKSESGNDLGLVISSVKSVSQSFFDDLEKPKQLAMPRPSPVPIKRVMKEEVPEPRSVLIRSNGTNGAPNGSNPPPKTESPIPDSTPSSSTSGDRDPLELPSPTEPEPSISLLAPKLKKPKLEPDPGINRQPDDIILSSTRRTARAVTYSEADQPKYISIIYKHKNGKTSKRRIFPCGQCTSKFENIETRKMHFLAVHGSSAKTRMERMTPVDEPPTIVPHIIPAYLDNDDENME